MKIKGMRWYIIALISTGTVLNYVARNSLGVLAPQLKSNLHISTQQYSYIVGAFQAAYTFAQPFCGMIVDHMGLRLGFALLVVGWGVSNMLNAFASTWIGLAICRALLGMTEASAIPSGMKVVAEWFPKPERSIATGYFNIGTSFGAMLAPPIVGFLSVLYGWRAAFVATGILGIFWAVVWYWLYRTPHEHPAITSEELARIDDGTQSDAAADTQRSRARDILSQPKFWAIAVPRFLCEPAWQTFSFWMPLYLVSERGFDIKSLALYGWLPFLAADFGGLAGGYFSPAVMKLFDTNVITSRVTGVALASILMIAPGCVMFVRSPIWAVALLSIGGFAHQMYSILINTLSADLFPRRQVGTANGFVGQAGWIGGLLFSLAIGQWSGAIGFAPLFSCLSIFDLIGAVFLAVMVSRFNLAQLYGR